MTLNVLIVTKNIQTTSTQHNPYQLHAQSDLHTNTNPEVIKHVVVL